MGEVMVVERGVAGCTGCRRHAGGRGRVRGRIRGPAEAVGALDWIDQMQLNRRNLTPDQVSLLRGRRYNRLEKHAKAPSGHFVPMEKSAETLGKEHGVTGRTIKRDGQFAEAVEKVKAIDPEIEVMTGSSYTRGVGGRWRG